MTRIPDEYTGGGGGAVIRGSQPQSGAGIADPIRRWVRQHALKFGAEIERSHVRTKYQPYGPAGFYMLAYSGIPYYRESYGYDVQGDNRRMSAPTRRISGPRAG